MGNMKIITGSTGTAHVTSADDRAFNCGLLGEDSYVLNVGSCFAKNIVSNNEVTLADGELSLQGCHARIDYGDSESCAIDNGTAGMYRSDLIVARYTLDTNTGYESADIVVIKGTPSASGYSDPSYNEGSLREGDAIVDFPLYRVKLNGINIDSVEELFNIVGNLSELTTDIYSMKVVNSIPSVGTPRTLYLSTT